MKTKIDKVPVRNKGFSGAISLPMLPDLIQVYTLAQTTGALGIRCGDRFGTIWFDEGNIVHALCGDRTAEAAVYEMLSWPDGAFSLDQETEPAEATITGSWQAMLLEGYRLLDEAARESKPGDMTEDGTLSSRIATPVDLASRSVARSSTHSDRRVPQLETSARPASKTVKGTPKSANVLRGTWLPQVSSKDSSHGVLEKKATPQEKLSKIATLDGFLSVCVVDSNSGRVLLSEGDGDTINLDLAAASNTDVVRAERKTIASLGLKDEVGDILITLGKEYHLIRPLSNKENLFFYLVLDRDRGNLAMARFVLSDVEKTVVI